MSETNQCNKFLKINFENINIMEEKFSIFTQIEIFLKFRIAINTKRHKKLKISKKKSVEHRVFPGGLPPKY